jgi:putative glutamine amidotransferase
LTSHDFDSDNVVKLLKRVALTYSDRSKIQPYVSALEAAGLEVVPLGPDFQAGMDGMDGLVLSGGIDLNPALYEQPRHPEADDPNDLRDALELDLLSEALARDLPVLAICRGMQLFNVAAGGTLHQHIGEHAAHQRYDREKPEPVHSVNVVEGSRLAQIVGAGNLAVNSRHHQAVDSVGHGLIVSARAEDGVIEGIEMPDKRFALAVQWHPEDQAPADRTQARLFQAFAEAL